ncbi:MAG: SDR family NAD(P)-dependent oxidoreductase [Jatrophihabitans sp.]|uniref:SDR family NAD(P)-dependent oxidoreductase n=1 Tax=Jatrophihabitans sp. TaxID=1932789 RepID=UPI00390DA3E0
MTERFAVAGARTLLTGATGGLGQAIARALRSGGAELVLTGRRTDVLQPLADALGATAIAADLASAADVERLSTEAGQIDLLVLNAALPGSGAVLDYTPEQIERALRVNVLSPALMARRFAADMVARGHGHIVFIGSLSGLAATPGTGVYSMTKFGLRGFAHGLRQDLHGTGVGVSIVQPGFVRGAGMFADTGLKPPRGAGTVSTDQVVAAVRESIERNRAEINVAPVALRVGSHLSGFAPGLAAKLARRLGTEKHAAEFADRQKDKR